MGYILLILVVLALVSGKNPDGFIKFNNSKQPAGCSR